MCYGHEGSRGLNLAYLSVDFQTSAHLMSSASKLLYPNDICVREKILGKSVPGITPMEHRTRCHGPPCGIVGM